MFIFFSRGSQQPVNSIENHGGRVGFREYRLKDNISVLLDGASEFKVNTGGIGITIPEH
jgi:hypothetical protein